MILLNRSVEHKMAHNKKYQYIEAKWEFHMDESDIPNHSMRQRFNWIQVTQRKNLGEHSDRDWECLTWFKGSRTNTFDKKTKDRQKQEIIKIVERFMLDNNTPLHYFYEQAPHK